MLFGLTSRTRAHLLCAGFRLREGIFKLDFAGDARLNLAKVEGSGGGGLGEGEVGGRRADAAQGWLRSGGVESDGETVAGRHLRAAGGAGGTLGRAACCGDDQYCGMAEGDA